MQERDASLDSRIGGEDGEIVGSIFNERQERILKIAVVVMGAMLVIGFALLVALVVYRASKTKPVAPLAPAGVSVPLAGGAAEAAIPKGATWLASSIDGNRLVVTLKTADGGLQLMVIDIAGGQLIGDMRLKAGQQP
jgi:hypothetical protein